MVPYECQNEALKGMTFIAINVTVTQIDTLSKKTAYEISLNPCGDYAQIDKRSRFSLATPLAIKFGKSSYTFIKHGHRTKGLQTL